MAIKTVAQAQLNRRLKENLSSEIEILKGLQHPHIAALIDCQQTSSHIHLVMEYCAMGDLSMFIKKRDTLVDHELTRDIIEKYPNPPGGGLNEVLVRHFLKQLASAIQFLRSRDLAHRDVKPQNLLLNPSPQSYAKGLLGTVSYKGSEDSFSPLVGVDSLPMLKIADFGFARSLPSTSLADTLCGSPLYMAPEILRYEKYDATTDLWSVGTVLYEMAVGKAPFRAANHVELLRKIELGRDKIVFPDGVEASDSVKRLTRGLLKRQPVERISFRAFFESSVVKGDIPGVVEGDTQIRPGDREEALKSARRRSSQSARVQAVPDQPSPSDHGTTAPATAQADAPRQTTPRPLSGASSRPATGVRRVGSRDKPDLQRAAVMGRQTGGGGGPSRPPSSGVPEVRETDFASAAATERQKGKNTTTGSPETSLLKEQMQARDTRDQHSTAADDHAAIVAAQKEKERAAQDVAFERDYVVVEKRAVEVNAFADELAASPRLQQQQQKQPAARHAGAVVRRATTTAAGPTARGEPAGANREVSPGETTRTGTTSHRRQVSHGAAELVPNTTSATSAISKAINLASGRLFGVNISPPLTLAKGGRSPPISYSPFPQYPLADANRTVSGDGEKKTTDAVLDEEAKVVQVLEEYATRSDVVFGFAEVKYKQLVPLTPSSQQEATIRPGELSPTADVDPDDAGDGGLTDDAVVTLCEEALVLYVKSLSLLAKGMDIAGAWWSRKNRSEITGDSPPARQDGSSAAAVVNRINSVVQWMRSRFNEVLQKADYSRLRLFNSQKRLPSDHPSHPGNFSAGHSSTEQIIVGTGITAERLMYDRALEMSRTAAINELTGEDLPGCDIAYVTAIRMLEAVLESDEDDYSKKKNHDGEDKTDATEQNAPVDGMEAEDRQTVVKREFSQLSLLFQINFIYEFFEDG